MDANRKQAMLNNCDSNWRNQYQQDKSVRRVLAKLTPDLIIELLDKSTGAARHAARELLSRMETYKDKWQIRATAAQGGTPETGSVDETLQITVRAGGIMFHLYLKENPRLRIIQIMR